MSELLIKNGVLVSCENPSEDIVIPEGVKKIGRGVFAYATDIKYIEFPSTLKTIGADAFRWCKNLKKIILPDSVTSIEKNAFSCSDIESIVLPPKLSSIPEECFFNSKIKEITIPEKVTMIGNSAFEFCFGLEKVSIYSENITIKESAFYNCCKLHHLIMPSSAKMEHRAFGLCELLANNEGFIILNDTLFESPAMYKNKIVKIPNGVKTIDDATPRINADMRYKDDNGKIISEFCEKVIIPQSVERYEPSAFSWKYLKEIVAYSSAPLNILVFYNCPNLSELTVPRNVEISENIFSSYEEENQKRLAKLKIHYI